ncbi:LysE family translocator [Streptomyces sp. NPDC059639]|uniref:LysE family translocator n=1 Tax=Streptomyces sp. NPDC059639 TaxID=3346891 RepID=UPI0036846059
MSASLGRFTAFALMVIAVAAGLGAVPAASELAFNIIKWRGVAYLLCLGVRTLATACRERIETEQGSQEGGSSAADTGRQETVRPLRLARQEFVVAASNPKALDSLYGLPSTVSFTRC